MCTVRISFPRCSTLLGLACLLMAACESSEFWSASEPSGSPAELASTSFPKAALSPSRSVETNTLGDRSRA